MTELGLNCLPVGVTSLGKNVYPVSTTSAEPDAADVITEHFAGESYVVLVVWCRSMLTKNTCLEKTTCQNAAYIGGWGLHPLKARSLVFNTLA